MEYFLITLTFLFTWPGILLTIGLFFLPWVWIYTYVRPRQLEPLRRHFNGTVSVKGILTGDLLKFTLADRSFTLRSQATGGVDANRTRLTYYLSALVNKQSAFYLGNVSLNKYFFRFNLGSGEFKSTLALGSNSYEIGAENRSTLDRLQTTLQEHKSLAADLELLLAAPWAHVKVRPVYQVGTGLVHEFTYYGLPQVDIFDPATIDTHVKALDRLVRGLIV